MLRRSAAWLLLPLASAPVDQHENCQQWAEGGECDRNPQYMQQQCAKACSGAKSYVSQLKRECNGYAKQGECSRNPAFMLSSCRAECEAWEKEHGLRIDRDASCVEWSLLCLLYTSPSPRDS